MLALVFDGAEAHLREVAEPAAAPGEVVVSVRLSGVCRTDLEILRGYMGFRGVMGHEYVGTVVSGPAPWTGRRVVGEINFPCGICPSCLAGCGHHCPSRTVLGIVGHDGCFAERVAVPLSSLHPVPDELPDDAAVFVEPLAAAFRILEQVAIPRDDDGRGCHESVLVLGDGRLGLLVGLVLRPHAQVVLVGKHPSKLALASRLGLRAMPLHAFVPDRSFPLVVDATGRPEGFALALRAVRPLGTIVLKSTFAAPSGLDLAPLVVGEVTVVGSRCGPFSTAIDALASGAIDPRPLVTRCFTLGQGEDALKAAADGESLKVLIAPVVDGGRPDHRG
jgi:threonine dehydrogenase-like Zn-dependent dehydrogenase